MELALWSVSKPREITFMRYLPSPSPKSLGLLKNEAWKQNIDMDKSHCFVSAGTWFSQSGQNQTGLLIKIMEVQKTTGLDLFFLMALNQLTFLFCIFAPGYHKKIVPQVP